MRTAIVNIKTIVTGDWRKPFANGDAIVMNNGRIAKVGTASAAELRKCDVVLDAGGMTAMPGMIDSQVHIAFGDYTPRQRAIGFLESYLHGGTTTSITASEVHVPGRPSDVDGVKALAVAAKKCFDNYRPGGMRVHGGAILLEPGLKQKDFDEIAKQGIWLAKAGFSKVKTPYEYTPLVRMAQKAGMIVNVHTGGASIPGSSPLARSSCSRSRMAARRFDRSPRKAARASPSRCPHSRFIPSLINGSGKSPFSANLISALIIFYDVI